VEHPWQGDFALHRNQSLDLARGQWILVLDADEELEPESAAGLRPLLARPELAGADALFIEILHLAQDGGHGLQIIPRLFRNFAGISFEGRIHERLAGGNRRALRAPVRLIHHGFAQGPEVMAAKAGRNLGLIRDWLAQEPDNPTAWTYLAQTQMASPATAAEALSAGGRALELARAQGVGPRGLPSIFHPILMALTQLGRREELVEFAGRCLAELPDYPDPLYSLAWAQMQAGRWPEARAAARRLVELQDHWRAKPLEYPYGDNLTLYLLPRVLGWWGLAAWRLGLAAEARQVLARLEQEQGGEEAARELARELAGVGG
jgi:tetratricopeptide (TPR) repeat protein